MITSYQAKSALLKRQIQKMTRDNKPLDLDKFLALIDQAYEDQANERRMADRALRLMSSELLKSNQDLKRQTLELQSSKQELLDATQQISASARAYGMAEVATNVLHNIGNILNSVNTTISILGQRFKDNKFNNLLIIADLIKSNEDNLVEFLTTDLKGQHIPKYVCDLASYWENQREYLKVELNLLEQNVEHITDCITLQQSMTKTSGLNEPIKIASLIDSILEFHLKDFNEHNITLIKNYEDLPILIIDRIKLYQIMVNLIQNAKQSTLATNSSDRKIFILVCKLGKKLTISIEDNGIGISADNLSKIFTHGFTTKKDGHGFGLHYCAGAVTEMGGTIKASSPGLGEGAKFTLKMPFIPHEQYGGNHAAK